MTTDSEWFTDTAVVPSDVPIPGGEETHDEDAVGPNVIDPHKPTPAENEPADEESVQDRLDRIESVLFDLNAKVTGTLTTVNETLAQVVPFLDSLKDSKVGKMLGLADSKDETPKTKGRFF